MQSIETLKNRIINADFRDVLKDLPDKCFDLLLTDPPYGIDIIGQRIKKDSDGRYGYTQFAHKKWDERRPTLEDFNEMIRVSKNQIIWGGNYFADLLRPSQGWLCWDKGQRDFSLADGELAWTSFDKAMRIRTYPRALALKDGKIHPTQKPLEIIEWCLELRSKKGDLILDCYSGSGTTAVACHELDRNFVCIEVDSEYYEQSVKRLKEVQRQEKLFKVADYKTTQMRFI